MQNESQWRTPDWWLSPYNHVDEVRGQFSLPAEVRIHDVTLRESMQSPRVGLLPEEKIRIAKSLDRLGVYSIENGAYMSPIEKEVTAELVRMHKRGEITAKITPLVHVSEADVDIALDVGADRVLISTSINPWINKNLFGTTEDETIEKLARVVAYAKQNDLFVTAQIYDTYRAPLDFLERAVKTFVNESGADSIAISDTRGFALPWTVAHVVRTLKSWIPQTIIEHHGHNDFGMATAMMVAAVTGGADVVHTSVNNIGERVGNAATEETAMALELLLGVRTGINKEHIQPTCELVAELTKHPIARNKPISGENMFISGSGQVVWRHEKLGKTDRPHADSAFNPAVIGKSGSSLEPVLGVSCGRAIVASVLANLDITVPDDKLNEIATRVREEAKLLKWSLSTDQFKAIVREVSGAEAP